MNLKRLLICFISLIYIYFIFATPKKVEATWIKTSNNPVVPIGSPNSWDQSLVGSSSIVFDGTIFRMWYEGNNGNIWRIGYATSNNGVDWIKYPNFILEKLDNFSNFNVHDPKVLFKDNNYKMWFAASEPNIRNIHINFTESSSGTSWNSPIINILPVSLSWENDLGISFPYTSLINNEYKIWYAARGNLEGSTRWRIGYATSADGINWTKHPLPVLQAQESWEGADVGNPSVLYDPSSGYEMFYHGDHGIGRATSDDGINWVKDPANPILIPTAGTFDSNRVFNPYVLKIDNIYYMWYTGINSAGVWQIGLATSASLPVSTLTPTLTPTVIPTETPTPTPSLTPTITPITPATNSPIIIIPGLGASWNPKDIFSCSIDTSGKWELAPYVSLYNRLLNTLTENAGLTLNQDVYLYTYDWRQPLDKQAENFKTYLDNILVTKPQGTKVRLVGHSLGGLIIRSYLEHYPNSHRALSALTVAAPHAGTLIAYPIWEKGEIKVDDLLLQITINQVITNCKAVRVSILPQKSIPIIKFRNNREIVQYFVPVVKQLLPIFDYLKLNKQIKPVTELKVQNDWLPLHPFPQDSYNLNFATLSGENMPTLRFFRVTKPSIREQAFGDWVDGKPESDEKIINGDGTVLNFSSQLTGIRNETLSGNHTDIISSEAGITKILNFLGLEGILVAPAVILPEEISESALTFSLDGEADIKITDPNGKLLKVKNNIFVSYNPQIGLYRLEIISDKSKDANLHLSYVERKKEPQTQSIIIPLVRNRPKRFYLIYNPADPKPLNIISL